MPDSAFLRGRDRLLLVLVVLGCGLPAVLVPHPVSVPEARLVQHLALAATDSLEGTAGTDGSTWLDPVTRGVLWLAETPGHWLGAGQADTALRVTALLAVVILVQMTAELASRLRGHSFGVLAGIIAGTTAGTVEAVWHGAPDLWAGIAVMLPALHGRGSRSTSERRRVLLLSGRPSGAVSRCLTAGISAAVVASLAGPRALLLVALLLCVMESGMEVVRRGTVMQDWRTRGWLVWCRRCAWRPVLICAAGVVIFGLVPDRLFPSQVMVPGWSTVSAARTDLAWRALPWGLLVLPGLWITRHEAVASGASRERWLWCQTAALSLAAVLADQTVLLIAATGPGGILAAAGLECLGDRMLRAVAPSRKRTLRRRLRRALVSTSALGTALLVCHSELIRPETTEGILLSELRAALADGQPVYVDQRLGALSDFLLYEAARDNADTQLLTEIPATAEAIAVPGRPGVTTGGWLLTSAHLPPPEMDRIRVEPIVESGSEWRITVSKLVPVEAERVAVVPEANRSQ